MHDYYPRYREDLEKAEPITDLFTAVSLLIPNYNSSGNRYLILNNGRIRHPNRPPYIIHDHFYRRYGEYAGSDLFRVAEDLIEMLTELTDGHSYFGGKDESIRKFHLGNSQWWHRKCEEKAELLRQHLVPGTHGWSSLYKYQHLAYWPIWCISTDGGWSQSSTPKGVCFKNPMDECWVVQFDGTVLEESAFEEHAKAESDKIFEKFHPKQKVN